MRKMIKMTIHKIKSIQHAIVELPIESGVYAVIGNNGTGKSTIIYSLAQLINSRSLNSFDIGVGDGDSYVEFEYNGIINRWDVKQDLHNSRNILLPLPKKQIRINGMYEGSLFYGFRFQNYSKVKNLIDSGKINSDLLNNADDYIVEKLGYILHGKENYYKNFKIKRIKNKGTVKQMQLNETPYFIPIANTYISQYGMSSGESLMLSLLHFIYHSIVRRSLDEKLPVLMLIDEIELALHPIAVSRLLSLLDELTKERTNLTIILTSHSPEVINKIQPQNMFMIEPNPDNPENTLSITNPCYPSYAIRDVYRHDGYDWLLLVEDELAQIILEKTISELNLSDSKLIHVTPVGGWFNVLKLQYDLLNSNVLGAEKKIISILDGDIKKECGKKFQSMPKLFFPIASIEKYLKKVLIDNKNFTIFKKVNDNLFPLMSLTEVVQNYNNQNKKIDSDGKIFYRDYLLETVKKRNIEERQFILQISTIIKENVDFSSFNDSLTRLLE